MIDQIAHAVVEAAAREVQSSGRGHRVFPFTVIGVTVAAPSRDARMGIVRDGRTVPVPRGTRRVRLLSGDEIVLGEARLRVRFGADPSGELSCDPPTSTLQSTSLSLAASPLET